MKTTKKYKFTAASAVATLTLIAAPTAVLASGYEYNYGIAQKNYAFSNVGGQYNQAHTYQGSTTLAKNGGEVEQTNWSAITICGDCNYAEAGQGNLVSTPTGGPVKQINTSNIVLQGCGNRVTHTNNNVIK